MREQHPSFATKGNARPSQPLKRARMSEYMNHSIWHSPGGFADWPRDGLSEAARGGASRFRMP
eukprot:4861312-Alexandrium_andersonii.AAC.1